MTAIPSVAILIGATESGAIIMAQQPQQIHTQQSPVSDPENVPEILCVGPFNIVVTGAFATITFSHIRPDADALIRQSTISPKSIVRARIVLPADGLSVMRDVIDETIRNAKAAADNTPPITGGTVRH